MNLIMMGLDPGPLGKSVGSASDVGFGNFVPTGIKSLVNVVRLVVLIPRGVESKLGQLTGSFWCLKY